MVDLSIDDIEVFIFDFDGVLTNNMVYVAEDGKELVSCNRSDGLAFDAFRRLQKSVFIFSTEKNPVVYARAKKLKVPVLQGIDDKLQALKQFAKENNFQREKIFYTGNDLNDYKCIEFCGYSSCPFDSHPKIKEIVTFPLKTKGGNGVVREILEDIFKINLINILYP